MTSCELMNGFSSVGTKPKVVEEEEEEDDDGQSSEVSDSELPDDEGTEPVLQVRMLARTHARTHTQIRISWVEGPLNRPTWHALLRPPLSPVTLN